MVLESHKFKFFNGADPCHKLPGQLMCLFEAPLDTELLGGLQDTAAYCVAATWTSARGVQGQGLEF